MKNYILPLLALLLCLTACDVETQSTETSSAPEVTEELVEDLPVESPQDPIAELDWEHPSERFVSSGETEVIFEHIDYLQYKLTESEKVTYGNMNTERGFMDESNATTYVLNWDQDQADQKFIVSYSKENIKMYDSDQKEIPGIDYIFMDID